VKNKDKIEQDDVPGGLTHNPFASLRPTGAPEVGSQGASPREVVPAEPAAGRPAAPTGSSVGRLVVQREKKGRGGKTVTRIIDCGQLPVEIEQLARQLKRALGCGASVDGADILLQGALTDRAAEWLGKQYGVAVTIGN